ncbi:hypothetical protein ACFLTI_00435 [Bacteroidota bacterium]
MTRKIINIDEVEVIGLRWSRFKHKIIHMPSPLINNTDFDIESLNLLSIDELKNIIPNSKTNIIRTDIPTVGISIPFQIPSKKDKALKRVNELKFQDELNNKVRNKLYILIDTFVDMNEEEADKFIRFCKISRAFILRSSDYEILKILENKYKDYLRLKKT